MNLFIYLINFYSGQIWLENESSITEYVAGEADQLKTWTKQPARLF